MKNRDRQDVLKQNNKGIPLVPQLLSSHAESFIKAADILYDMGYREINLNAGCPSQTVTAKGKGAGFLKDTEKMHAFFSDVFEWTEREMPADDKMKISVKTRIGIHHIEEAALLMQVYNQYPISELIIHPRLKDEQYRGSVHMDIYEAMQKTAHMPICYNGDIKTVEDYQRLKACSSFDAVMIGRGLVQNPALVREIVTGRKRNKEEMQQFYTAYFQNICAVIPDTKSILYKMKDFWNFFYCSFEESEDAVKKIRKAKTMGEYQCAVNGIFRECPLKTTEKIENPV